MRIAGIGLIVACASSPVFADPFLDGNVLHTLCQRDMNALQAYVSGWHDKRDIDSIGTAYSLKENPQSKAANFANNMASGLYCMPDALTMGQLGDVVCQYLEQNPAERHRGGAAIMEQALDKAFPCPQ